MAQPLILGNLNWMGVAHESNSASKMGMMLAVVGQIIFSIAAGLCSLYMYNSFIPFFSCSGIFMGAFIIIDAIVLLYNERNEY